MTFASEQARDLWARTRVRVWPERYVIVSLPRARVAEAVAGLPGSGEVFVTALAERDEVSITLPEAAWQAHPLRPEARAVSGPWRVLTFDLDLALDVTGYLAPAAAALARAGVPIVPQCAYSKDHLLVPEERLDDAVEALNRLVAEARPESS